MIEFPCACGKLLGVGEELAGKRVRCPACRAVVDVPGAGPSPFPGAPRAGVHDATPSADADYTGPFAAVIAPTPTFTGGPRTSAAAVAGMLLGLVGCFCVPVPIGLGFSIAGLIFISRSPQTLGGTGFAVAGLVLNSMWLLFWFANLFLLPTSSTAPAPVPPTAPPLPAAATAPACADNLRNLYTILDTYLAVKKEYPQAAGARFLDVLERYGRDQFPRLSFTIRAPGGAHPARTAYRGPTHPLRKGAPAGTPIIADWADEHPDGALHVLYLDGSVRTLTAGSPDYAAALEATQ